MRDPRAKIEISWNLDLLPGWNATPADLIELIEREVLERIPHYEPEVKVVQNGLREGCGEDSA